MMKGRMRKVFSDLVIVKKEVRAYMVPTHSSQVSCNRIKGKCFPCETNSTSPPVKWF